MPEPGMGANNDHGVGGSDRSTDRPDDNDRGGSREDKGSFDRAMDNAERPDRAPAETTAKSDDKDDTRATDKNDDRSERAAGPPGIGAPPSSPSPTDTANETDDDDMPEERGLLDRVADTLTAPPTDAEGNTRSASPVSDRIKNHTANYSIADLRNVFTDDPDATPERSQALANGAAVMDGVVVAPSLKEQVQLYQADLRLQQRGLEYEKSVLAQKAHPLSSDTIRATEIDQELENLAGRRELVETVTRTNVDTGITPEILHFDPKKDGQMVVAYGDIKDATHIAVMVPGMTTDLANFKITNDRAKDLVETLLEDDAVSSPAVISYLGYDAPDDFDEAIFDDHAVEGAAVLSDFLESLPEDAETHVLAHSYGSLLAGKAMVEGARPDYLHVLGSPGIGVDRLDELNLEGRTIVTVTSNPEDRVVQLGPHGAMPPEGAISYPAMGHGHSEYFNPDDLADILAGRQIPLEGQQ